MRIFCGPQIVDALQSRSELLRKQEFRGFILKQRGEIQPPRGECQIRPLMMVLLKECVALMCCTRGNIETFNF
jgi:hypothetical protein